MKLTKAQRAAVDLIRENGGEVVGSRTFGNYNYRYETTCGEHRINSRVIDNLRLTGVLKLNRQGQFDQILALAPEYKGAEE